MYTCNIPTNWHNQLVDVPYNVHDSGDKKIKYYNNHKLDICRTTEKTYHMLPFGGRWIIQMGSVKSLQYIKSHCTTTAEHKWSTLHTYAWSNKVAVTKMFLFRCSSTLVARHEVQQQTEKKWAKQTEEKWKKIKWGSSKVGTRPTAVYITTIIYIYIV